MADQFDAIATTTLQKYVETQLVDNIFQADPMYGFFMEKGRMKTEDGGEQLQVPIIHGKNDTAGSFSGYDTLDNTPQEGLGNALYSWKQNHVSIVISGKEKAINSGEAAKIKLLESKIMQAEESLREDMTTQLYGDGTGNGGKDITGLQAQLSTSGSLAGIDPATYTWWAPVSDTTSESVDTSWLRTMVNNVRGSGSIGKMKDGGKNSSMARAGVVDLIIAPQDGYESFEALVEPHLRVQGLTLGELGFDSLKFKGSEITWSDNMPSDTWYFLSTRYMYVVTHKDVNWKVTPFLTPTNQDASVSHIFWMGNLVANQRRRLGVATNKSA